MGAGDFFIMDYVPGKGRNSNLVGAVEVGYLQDGENVKVAGVGAWSDQDRRDMSSSEGTLKYEYYGRVMEVMAQGVTTHKRLRHPKFIRWRPDKQSYDCDKSELYGFRRV